MKVEIHFLDDNEKIYKKVFINDIVDQAIWIGDGIHDFVEFEEDEEAEFLTIE